MRFPLLALAAACLFTSCQRKADASVASVASDTVETCKQTLDNQYFARGYDKHMIVTYRAGDELKGLIQQGVFKYRLIQVTVDLMGNGKTTEGLYHCYYSVDGQHYAIID